MKTKTIKQRQYKYKDWSRLYVNKYVQIEV